MPPPRTRVGLSIVNQMEIILQLLFLTTAQIQLICLLVLFFLERHLLCIEVSFKDHLQRMR